MIRNLKMSSLESKVLNILTQANLSFEREKQFKDCYNGYYRFDFYIPKFNIAIEVNGAQHYEFTKFFYKTRSDFTKAQERDRRKISYCLAHDIKLYCIPYWEVENLISFNDLTQNRFLAKSKFHNDNVWNQQKNKKY